MVAAATVIAIVEAIAAVIKTAVDVGPEIIKGVQDAKPFAEAIYNSLIKGQKVSDEDLKKLEDQLTELSNQLQKPLPPE